MKSTQAFLTITLLLSLAVDSQAALITFDGLGVNTQKPVVVDGFVFDYLNENGWCICTVGQSSGQISNGTDQILVRDTRDGASSISMAVDGGGVFSLTSFLAADGLLGMGGRTIEVVGSLFGGGQVMESFITTASTQSFFQLQAAFTNLTSVVFNNFGNTGDGMALDNILVNEAPGGNVPTPATLALLGLGLAGLGWSRRKKA